MARGRHAGEGSGAAARPASVRRRDRRRGGDPRPVRRPQPHVLLRRLRRHQGDARRDDGEYRADGGNPHRRLQQLSRSQRQPDPDLRSAHDPSSTATGRIVRDQFPNNIIPAGPHALRRPEHREHLPAAEQRQQQLRQLHLDAQPGDHRQRVLRPRRPPAVGQRLLLRPVQLRQVQARRAAGPGELLPAHAAGGRRPLRSRPVHRRHPEHEADDARRRVQLLEDSAPRPSSTSFASAMPTPRRSRRNPTTATTPRNPWGFTASTSATSRPASRTSASRTSPAFPADRRSCRSTPASSTTRSRTCWCG